jgi:hypothetical protein
MGFIPFSDKPVKYNDPETGVSYSLRQPTDEVEMKLIEIRKKYPDKFGDGNEVSLRAYLNESVDVILLGWGHPTMALEVFPKENPSKIMPSRLKIQILSFWNTQGNFTGEELKK